MTKRVMKYMTRMGQKTGMLKNSKKVQPKPMSVAFVAEYQNLNSGSRRMKGRNSSFCLVGSANPSSARSKSVSMIELWIQSLCKITVFCFELCHRRVYLGREEGEQEVQVIDEERVRYDVPSLQ